MTYESGSEHIQYLDQLAQEDARELKIKEQEYGSSWLRRGGVGAYMMLARKFDRMEVQTKEHGYDIFKAVETDGRESGLIDDIRDLRRYLLLVESELVARGVVHLK